MKHAGHFLLTGLAVLTGIVLQITANPTSLPGQLGTWAPAAGMAAKWLYYALTNNALPPPPSTGGP